MGMTSGSVRCPDVPLPQSSSLDTGFALSMTPENIKPLLENAKEVQVRCIECLGELRQLLGCVKVIGVVITKVVVQADLVRVDCGVDDPDDGKCDWRKCWGERESARSQRDSAGEAVALTKAEELPSNHTCVAPPPALADGPTRCELPPSTAE